MSNPGYWLCPLSLMSKRYPGTILDVNRRVWCLLLALAGCDPGTLFGTGDSSADRGLGTRGGYRDATTLIVGRASDARTLDPARAVVQESAEVAMQIFDRLVHLRPGQREPEKALAESWTVEDNGRSWVFELRRDVRFHDGTPFTADAVVFSFERQRDIQHPYHFDDIGYWRNYFANVVRVEKLDDYRVRIQLEREYGPFLANMSIFSMSVVSPTAFVERAGRVEFQPIGTGPFKYKSWTGGRLVLERNGDYWGQVPKFGQLVFRSIPDERQRMTALVSGAIDIALDTPPEERKFVRLHPRLRLHETTENAVTYLAMNTMRPPFDDIRVRRAINLAINKEPMVRALWHGSAKPAHTPVPPSIWGHYAVPEPYRYDPQAAIALLDAAVMNGALDPNRTYELYVSATPRQYLPNPERLARGVVANLEDIGLQVELRLQPYEQHESSLQRGGFDLCIDGWVGDTGDPDNFLYLLLSGANVQQDARSTFNMARFRNPQVDGELTYAQESIDASERARHYKLVQRLVHEQAPWVPIAHSSMGIAARSDIANLQTGVSGLVEYSAATRRTSGPNQ